MTLLRSLLLSGAALVAATPAPAQDDSRAPRGSDTELGATASEFTARDGETLYLTACAGCHQPQGQGAVGAGQYPPLSGNARLQGGRYPAWIVVNGIGGMPALGDYMDDEQVVAVVSYMQQNLGNRHSPDLTPDAVADLRDAPAP